MHPQAQAIVNDILVNHLPRIREGLEKGYIDENQVLIVYDHCVRARILNNESLAVALLAELDQRGGLGIDTHKRIKTILNKP